MKTAFRYLLITAALLVFSFPALAQTVVNQGGGTRTAIPWRVSIATPGGSAAVLSGPLIYIPGVPTNVAVSGASAAMAVTAGTTIRVVCNIDVFYRVTAAAAVAVVTDNDLPARVIEYLVVPTGMGSMAFITAGGAGTCKVAIIPAS